MKNICSYPWSFCEIHAEGDVYPCCPAWCKKYSFGNLFEQSFEEIWNGEKAQKFRKEIENNRYTFCNRDICMHTSFCRTLAEIKTDTLNKDKGKYYPKQIKICFDTECNVACITCRNSIIRNSPTDMERLKILQEKIIPVLPYLENVQISGSGDPFGSQYAQGLIKYIAKNYPHIRFSIHSNGLIFTKEMAEKLGIFGKIDEVEISMHAATAETYNKIVKYSNFEKVLKNLEWLAQEKKQGNITNVVISFVVNQLNYTEMPAFVELANKFGITPVFRACRDRFTAFTQNYKAITVWKPSHPEYENFCRVMENPLMADVRIQGMLRDVSERPKVSVIMPVYNVEKYLPECLDSVINQTLENIEIICIDDGSTDNCLKILQEYAQKDERIIVITQKNQGAGPARNRGIEIAGGEYLSFLDADDFFEANMLQRFYDKAKVTGADITICDFWCFDNRTKTDYYTPYSLQYQNLPNKKIFSAKDCPNTIFNIVQSTVWSQFYRREFVVQNKLQFQNLPNHNDVYFSTTALALAEKIVCLEAKLIHHRKHAQSTVYNREYAFKSAYKAILACEEFLKEKNMYETYKISFLQKSFAAIFTGKSLREPILSIWKNFMRSEVIPHFKDGSGYFESLSFQVNEIEYEPNLSDSFDAFYENKKEKIVPLAFGIFNKLDFYTVAVSIQSVVSHANDNNFYDIYVLNDLNLSSNNIFWLENLSKKNIRVTMIDISAEALKSRLPLPEYANMNYWQLIVPYAIFGYDKILCVKNGIIFNCDPMDTLRQNLAQCVAAGSCRYKDKNYIEDTVGLIYEKFIGIDLLLINIKEWQEKNISEACWNLLAETSVKYDNPCREAINIVAKNDLFVWNGFLNGKMFLNTVSKNFSVDLNDLFILDFNELEPWKKPDRQYADIWWSYARMSPYYEAILFKCLGDVKSECAGGYADNTQTMDLDKIMENKDNLYPFMKEYIKEWFLKHITLGEKRQIHNMKLAEIAGKMKQLLT